MAFSSLKDYDLVKTITADNGLQLAKHERVSEATDVGFYFTRPYHSWERGANENTNGLVQQYIPRDQTSRTSRKSFWKRSRKS